MSAAVTRNGEKGVRVPSFMKKAWGLIDGDFFNFDHKVELKTKTASGVGFTASTTLKEDGPAYELSAKYKRDALSLDKFRVGSDGVVKADLTLSGVGTDDVNVTFKAQEGTLKAGKEKAAFGVDYSSADIGSVNASVDVINGGKFDLAALFTYEGFNLGGSVAADPHLPKPSGSDDKKFEVTDYNVMAGYKADDFSAGLATSGKLNAIHAAFGQKVSDRASVAAGFDFARGSGAWGFDFGGSCKVADDTTFAARVKSDNTVGFAYSQRFNSTVTATAAAEVNVKAPGSDKHKFGIKLNISA